MFNIKKFASSLCMVLSLIVYSNTSTAALIADPLEDVIVTSGNLDWVWASPCSGGCSSLINNWEYAGNLYNDILNAELGVGIWRYATVAEFATVPSKIDFGNGSKCAAQYFDNQWDHCDAANAFVRMPNGSYNELVLVRFNDLVQQQPGQVDEPGSVAILALGLLSLAIRRKTK